MATGLTKKQISNLYKNRNETSKPNAELYFCDSSILNSVSEKSSDSLKLCTYFLLEKLGAEKTWQLIRKVVVAGKLKQKAYENIGMIIRKSYKDASRAEPAEGIVTRIDIANHIYRPLMEHCILVKREHAKKFCFILQKATFDRDDPMAQMLFNISTPIIWRYLKATNLSVRMGAYFVQVNVFPPSTEDAIRITDYINEHCKSFLLALDDNSIEICIQAINNVSEAVSTYYDQIPTPYIEKIFNKFARLSKDDNNEIRAALFHGIRFFCGCAKAIKNFELLLKHICPEGIDDPIDRVRCNTFRLLNMVRETRTRVILPPKTESEEEPILDLSDVLYRLDYETTEGIEREIASLIYNSFFKKNMNSEERYKILNNMCRMNHSACLDLHRLLHTINEKEDTAGVMAHMSSILTVCSKVLNKIVLLRENLKEDEANSTSQNNTVNETQNQTITTGVTSETLNKRLQACMNVIDCMVVCFASMRYDPNFDYTTPQAVAVTRYLSEIACEIISKFEKRKDLTDTALSIISLIRSAGMQAAKLKNECARMLRRGHIDKRYLEIYGLIDMDELMGLLKKGLHQVENDLFAIENTPVRKKSKEEVKATLPSIAVEALLTLLNVPSCTQYIVEKYMHYLTGFIEQFERICSSCMANLQREHAVKMDVFFACWKVWTVISIMKFNESAFKSIDNKQKKPLTIVKESRRRSAVIKAEIEFDNVTDPMLKECQWMQQHISDCRELSANSDLVEHFYNMIVLHLRSYKHLKSVIQPVIDYVKELHKMQEEFPRKRSINQPYKAVLKAGEHAMEYAESDFIIMQPVE